MNLIGKEGKIITELYRKPLSANSILLADLGDPYHTVKWIPVGQMLCFRQICTKESFKEKA